VSQLQFQLDFSRIQIRSFTAWAKLLLDKVLHSAPISLQNALHTVHNWIPGSTGFAGLWTVFLIFVILESVQRWVSDRNFSWNCPHYELLRNSTRKEVAEEAALCTVSILHTPSRRFRKWWATWPPETVTHPPTHSPTSPKRMKRVSSEKEWR
jgi:hypothetical protein